jgi:xanthine dehydrogenase molybdopterin-binding subunit B
VQRFFSYKDVPGNNALGAIAHDEEVFVQKEVKHVGAVSDCTTELHFLTFTFPEFDY